MVIISLLASQMGLIMQDDDILRVKYRRILLKFQITFSRSIGVDLFERYSLDVSP